MRPPAQVQTQADSVSQAVPERVEAGRNADDPQNADHDDGEYHDRSVS